MEWSEILKSLEEIRDDLAINLQKKEADRLDVVLSRLEDEKVETKRRSTWGFASKIFCMIASIYIAVVPETIWSAIFWAIYTIGAILGIVHLKRLKDKDTMQMYIIWLILDVYAIVRLIIGLSW